MSMVGEMEKKNDKYWGSINNINLVFFVAVVLDLRYDLKYVKFWFKEWYEKDKGYAMSSRVRDVLKRLYTKKVGQNGVLSSSGSGNSASLSRDFGPSVGNAFGRFKTYNTRFKQHLADKDNVECKSKLDRYLLESFEDLDVEDFDILMWWKMNSSRY